MQPATQPCPTQMVGPQLPHVGFWYGEHFLGEARYRPDPDGGVQSAKTWLIESIRMLDHSYAGQAKVSRLLSRDCQVRIYRIGG